MRYRDGRHEPPFGRRLAGNRRVVSSYRQILLRFRQGASARPVSGVETSGAFEKPLLPCGSCRRMSACQPRGTTASLHERALLVAAQHDDRRAVEELLRRYEPLIGAIVARLRLPCGCDRGDIAQEARVGLLRAIRAWQPARGPFRAFAARCARGQALNALDTAGTRKHQLLSRAQSLDASQVRRRPWLRSLEPAFAVDDLARTRREPVRDPARRTTRRHHRRCRPGHRATDTRAARQRARRTADADHKGARRARRSAQRQVPTAARRRATHNPQGGQHRAAPSAPQARRPRHARRRSDSARASQLQPLAGSNDRGAGRAGGRPRPPWEQTRAVHG